MSDRVLVLAWLVDHLATRDPGRPLRVAVDGPPGSARTDLADDLAALLRGTGRPVVRVTSEDSLEGTISASEPDAVLLFDGTLVQRGPLRDLWDEVVHLDADPDVALAGAGAEDASSVVVDFRDPRRPRLLRPAE